MINILKNIFAGTIGAIVICIGCLAILFLIGQNIIFLLCARNILHSHIIIYVRRYMLGDILIG